jgi:NADH:ubiquinone oxidoreductase subunit C
MLGYGNIVIDLFKKNFISSCVVNYRDIYCIVNDNKDFFLLETFLKFLKKSFFFGRISLLDIYSLDFPSKSKRFEVVYVFTSYKRAYKFFMKSYLGINDFLYSISSFYSSANWLEREIWDMFGIFFYNHPDLRRILTDYGFDGFPLRKDFPLGGYFEVRYSEQRKGVVLLPYEVTQELRIFNFTNAWEGSILKK